VEADNQMQVTAEKTDLEEVITDADFKGGKKDRAFLAFQDRTSLYRDQVLRYYRFESGKVYDPLWVSDEGKVEAEQVPLCETCGARRTFEFQIMPQLLTHLQIDDSQVDSVDWGTLLVYTCPNSCQKTGQAFHNEFLWRQNFSNIGMPGQQHL